MCDRISVHVRSGVCCTMRASRSLRRALASCSSWLVAWSAPVFPDCRHERTGQRLCVRVTVELCFPA